MNRPSKLSIKKLKSHFNSFRKKHGVRVKWGNYSPHYNELCRTVFLPPITSQLSYIIALHELGHALTPRLQRAGDELKSLNDKLHHLKSEFRQNCTIQIKYKLLQQMNGVTEWAKRIQKRVGTRDWQWKNESLAWRFVFLNSLIWSPKYERYIDECISSYWNNHEGHITKELVNERLKFQKKYINPIFK